MKRQDALRMVKAAEDERDASILLQKAAHAVILRMIDRGCREYIDPIQGMADAMCFYCARDMDNNVEVHENDCPYVEAVILLGGAVR